MKYWTALILLLSSIPQVQAACTLTISASNVNIDWTLNFDYKAVLFTVTKSNNEACDYGIGFTKGTASDYTTRRAVSGAKTVRYQLYGDSAKTRILKEKGDVLSNNDVIMDAFPEGTNLQHTLQYFVEVPYAVVTSPTLVASGTYTENYTLNVYEGATATAWAGSPIATATVTLTITVPKIVALSLVDPGGIFEVAKTTKNSNFGTLAPGQTAKMDIRVRSNAGYRVTFSSENNGNLKHVLGPSLVPYNFYVNAVLLDMSSSKTVPVEGLNTAGQTGLDGHGFPVSAVIGSFGTTGKLAGEHSDQITITTTTTE